MQTSFSMLGFMALLLVYQLCGELLVWVFESRIPGPVVGMFLLFITLSLRPVWAERWLEPSRQFLRYLSLFFVPAGVGIMLHLDWLQQQGLQLLILLLISTVVSLLVTAWVMVLVMKLGRVLNK
jgi:holin-like protein